MPELCLVLIPSEMSGGSTIVFAHILYSLGSWALCGLPVFGSDVIPDGSAFYPLCTECYEAHNNSSDHPIELCDYPTLGDNP